MTHTVDERLRGEALRFALRFACPDCASFDEVEGRCSLGFPNAMHVDPSLEGRGEVTFCKAFELR